MKKIIMMCIILSSVSFGANKDYKILAIMGPEVKVEKIATHEVMVMKRSEAAKIGISESSSSSHKLSETFVDALMPDKNKPAVGEQHPSSVPPMDVIDGTVTTAYGAK